jgi:hypothetical protein
MSGGRRREPLARGRPYVSYRRRNAASRYIVLTRILLVAAAAALYGLHQDLWFWRSVRPLTLGFLPPGLAYHAAYCVACALLMWGLTRAFAPAAPGEPEPPGDRTH